VSPEETVLIVRHLERQGFAVAVCGTEPLVLQLTIPCENQQPVSLAR
jgi:hypothetical protein